MAASSRQKRDPREFLPLTHLGFHVLLALAEEPKHGYAIVRDVRERSAGAVNPGTGSFYSIIHGLTTSGLLTEVDATEPCADDRRRYYGLTSLGRAVLAAEASRLKALVTAAEKLRGRQTAKGGTR